MVCRGSAPRACAPIMWGGWYLAVAACFGCMGCLNGVRVGQWVVCMLFSYYMVWSGLVRLSFVWCGQDWYSCALCGVCLYAVQLSHSVVRTGIDILCVVSVCCSVITQCGQVWYGCALCEVCLCMGWTLDHGGGWTPVCRRCILLLVCVSQLLVCVTLLLVCVSQLLVHGSWLLVCVTLLLVCVS